MTIPMAAAGNIGSVEEYSGSYPVALFPKYDGYRCTTEGRQALSSTEKLIPSLYVQEVLKFLPSGMDGELTVGPNFQTSAAITRKSAEKIPFEYHIFDCFSPEVAGFSWNDRIEYAAFSIKTFWEAHPDYSSHVRMADYKIVYNSQELRSAFEELRTREGAIIRLTDYPYEAGKDSKSLIKIKPYSQSEAVILEVVQEKYGTNLKTVPPELWGTPKGRASSLNCRWLENGKSFGMAIPDHNDREWFWENVDEVIGETVTFKYIKSGTKDRPRHPGLIGLRPEWDMRAKGEAS